MTQPSKVIAFLDALDGSWDPSLGLVMASAIAIHALVYRIVLRRPSPLLSDRWSLPTRSDVDPRLVVGSALFGAGWGGAGYCPGPAVVSLAGGAATSVAFVTSMLVAMALTARLGGAGR